MPTKVITHAQEIEPKLEERIAEFVQTILHGARECFERDNQCLPIFFVLKGYQIEPHIFEVFTPETKYDIFEWMHKQVPLNDCCCFVIETWLAKAMKSEGVDDTLLRPEQRFDRRELVMVHVWMPNRTISICAEITRNPDALGPWEVFSDSDNPNGVQPGGAMLDGLKKKEGP